MTDLSADSPTDAAAPPEHVYALPELPPLDARSAAALALMEELDAQMAAYPDATVVLDPRRLADAVLDVVNNGQFPAIPAWLGEPRSIGGGVRAGDTRPEAVIRLDVEPGSERVEFVVETTCAHECSMEATVLVPAVDARTWHLAGLAACATAENPNRDVSTRGGNRQPDEARLVWPD